jgi:hypothetical protein
MSRFALLAIALVLTVLLMPQILVTAKEATPAATPPAGLVQPDPGDCTIEPVSLATFEQAIASPPALEPSPDMRFSRPGEGQRPWTMPAGEPADQETIDGITATLHMALACLNANNVPGFLACFSTGMQNLFFAQNPLPPEALPFLMATPVASTPDQWLGYLSIYDVRILADGRVAALGDDWDPTEPPFGVGTDFAIFVKEG